MCLESFYFLSMAYGWYRWTRPQETRAHHSLKTLARKNWFYIIIAGLIAYAGIFYLLTSYSHSTVASLDALTTTLSLIAQWLMCHKVIATWVLWFITDALYALIYMQKELPFHTLLMLLYTGMAMAGYLSWKKKSRPAALIAASQN